MEQARLEALVGRVLGDKFRLRACIGIGGSGAVFRADQIALGRTVAVKILSTDLADDPRLVRRFQDEALAASRLNHPNTVSVIDYGQSADGLLYLAMEYVKGPTLTQLVADHHPLPIDRVLDIVCQILAGIEEAHLAGVVHADLKSDNVIVDRRRPDWDVVKVVDFGIARLVNVPRDGDDRSICGTPEYMAPETITGAPPSFASDLYSVGVIFYELLAGETPFVGGPTVEVLTRQLKQAPAPPSARRAATGASPLPPEIEQAVLRALAKHPGDRYADAGAFRAALQALRDRRRDDSAVAFALCEACGARTPARFRFCPECGHQRPAAPATAPSGGGGLVEVVEPAAPPVAAGGLVPIPDDEPAATPARPRADTAALQLVGRDDVLDALAHHLAGATAPAVLHLAGPPGSGRTELLREAFTRAADGAGVTIYRSVPDPTGLATPLYPIRAAVAAVLALPPVCTLDELGRAAAELGLSERDLPGLAELFGHPGSLVDLEPLVRRREMIASTVRALQAATTQGPVAVVFEDVDDYDHPSQELVRRLAERSDECPALRVLVTSRPDLASQWRAAGEPIVLDPLGLDALEVVAAELARAGIAAPPSGEALLAATGGMPAHLDHVVRYLQEGGIIDDVLEHPGTTGGTPSLADLVAARISLLPRAALELAQVAAVFGLEVERDLLARAAELGPRALDTTLDKLAARDLLVDVHGVITFTSALVRDIVYDATPADVRRHHHAVVADLLAQVTGDPAVLGHHHDLAGHADLAADHLLRAGDRAAHYLDDEGACALYQRGLRSARGVLYAGDDDHDVTRYAALSVKLADALCASGQLGLARGVLDEVRPWTAGLPRLEAVVARSTAHLAVGEDDLAAATAAVRKAIGHAIASGDGALITDLYLDLAAVLTRAGDAETARRELEEGIDLVTLGEGMTASGGPADLWRLVIRLAQLASNGGDHGRARAIGEQALVHARRVGSRLGSARVQVILATECDRLGDAAAAARYREAALDELRTLGDRRSTAELILSVVSPARTLLRITPPALHEARTLAREVGWAEGAAASTPTDADAEVG